MPDARTKKLVIASTLADAHHAQEVVMKAVADAGFTADAGFAVRLAMDEALSNAVRHGNRMDPDKKITIEYTVTGDDLKIVVADEGSGFDPTDVPDPTLDENLEQPHGRGLMLMRAYMTKVYYNDQGNRVTLIKTRDCTLPRRAQA